MKGIFFSICIGNFGALDSMRVCHITVYHAKLEITYYTKASAT